MTFGLIEEISNLSNLADDAIREESVVIEDIPFKNDSAAVTCWSFKEEDVEGVETARSNKKRGSGITAEQAT